MITTLLLFLISLQAYSFDWQGHRGARGLYPENTIGAMKEALKYPVTTLELDVVISKDLEVVVSHQPWINPEICVSEKQNIFTLNYSDIVGIDCGSKFFARFPKQQKVSESKPRLLALIQETERTLKRLEGRVVAYSVEIKSSVDGEKQKLQPDYKTFSDLVVKILKDSLPVSRFMIQSFDWRVLNYIHEKHPEISLVALKKGSYKKETVLVGLDFVPKVFSPYYKDLSEQDMAYFHKMGMKVIPWTINTVKEIQDIKDMGVDGIITDYPQLIMEIDQKHCRGKKHLFQGKCITYPKHAIPSHLNPGWSCGPGYTIKRDSCIKIRVPTHSVLGADGKTWYCKKGYVRYRSKCKKL